MDELFGFIIAFISVAVLSSTFYTGEFVDVFCSKYLPDRYRTVKQKQEGGK